MFESVAGRFKAACVHIILFQTRFTISHNHDGFFQRSFILALVLRCSYVSLLLTVWTRKKIYILVSVMCHMSASAKQTDLAAKQEVSAYFSWANTDKHWRSVARSASCLHTAAITLGDLQKSFASIFLLWKIVIWIKLSWPVTSLSWELRNNEWAGLGDILAQQQLAILHFILNDKMLPACFPFIIFDKLLFNFPTLICIL